MALRIKQNGRWVDVKTLQDLDTSLSIEGMAADAKAVGDKIDDLPIAVYEQPDGSSYTEVLGLRPAKNIDIARTGNQVKIVVELADGEKVYYYMQLSSSGWAESIESNNTKCLINWTGGF